MAQELFDVLDENGVKTGKVATRNDCHRLGLWHRGVCVVVINDKNQVLMQQRSSSKEKYPGMWDLSVAGHVVAGEDSLSAASTELMEEIGVMLPRSVRVEDLRFLTSFRMRLVVSENFIENSYVDLFVYRVDLDEKNIKPQADEVQAIKFVNMNEVMEMKQQGKLHPRTEWVDVIYKFVNRF